MSFFAQTLYRSSATFPVISPACYDWITIPPRLQIMTRSLSLTVSEHHKPFPGFQFEISLLLLKLWLSSLSTSLRMRLAEQGVSIYWRVRGWLLWWAPWSVSVGKENPKIARIIRRQRSWSSGHLNVRVFRWRIQIREGAAFVVLVCLVPNEIPWALVSFSWKSPGLLNFGACCWDSCLSSLYPEPPLQFLNVILRWCLVAVRCCKFPCNCWT